jgi:hypothetical protein
MSTLLTIVIAGSLFGALALGAVLRPLLPTHHLSGESKDAVKLAMGLIATMTALLLGLLVSSAKGAYDTNRTSVVQMAAKVAFLDRVLTLYGPEAAEIRTKVRTAIAEAIHRMWPDEAGVPVDLAPDESAGDAVYVAMHRLSPHDDMQRDLKAQAIALAVDVAQIRTLLLAQSIPSLSIPMLLAVDVWLVIIFVSFTVVAPPNATTNVALVAAALSVVVAVFLILELDEPMAGVIKISSAPMLGVFAHLAK